LQLWRKFQYVLFSFSSVVPPLKYSYLLFLLVVGS
jgi:hypothetical protein